MSAVAEHWQPGEDPDEDERQPIFDVAEAGRLAENLAANCGWHVFPVRFDKKPATKNGFLDATNDPQGVRELWEHHPGQLVGIATGTVSGVAVLDIDLKHAATAAWWQANCPRLPRTRAFRTRSGGCHLYLEHRVGLGCSASKIAPGVDVRADGGYVVHWYAAGHPCLDHGPIAPWPEWLRPPAPKPLPPPSPTQPITTNTARYTAFIDAVLARVRAAADGIKHTALRNAALSLGGIAQAAGLSDAAATAALLAALPDTANDRKLAARTVAWGLARGREKPLQLQDRSRHVRRRAGHG